MTYAIFDLETVADESAVELVAAKAAPSNWKDAEKVAAKEAENAAKARAQMALDPYACRIVCASVFTPEKGLETWIAQDARAEYALLVAVWGRLKNRDRVLGYNVKAFDLPVVATRSRLLSVTVMPQRLSDVRAWGRYMDGVVDVQDLVFFGNPYSKEHSISRGLKSMAQRFGLEVPDDDESGSSIADLVACGAWDAVKYHCECDVRRTARLAMRFGVIPYAEV